MGDPRALGAIADFVSGYSNPAMGRLIGVPIEASIGRRLLEEAPDFTAALDLKPAENRASPDA